MSDPNTPEPAGSPTEPRVKAIGAQVLEKISELEAAGCGVHLYYCLCGQIILLSGTRLEDLERRPSDGAYALDNARHVYRLLARATGAVALSRRAGGFETQYRYACPRCALPVAYEFTPVRRDGPFSFVIDQALVGVQGAVPDGLDALLDAYEEDRDLWGVRKRQLGKGAA